MTAARRMDGLLLQTVVTFGMTMQPPRKADPRMREVGEVGDLGEEASEVVPREKARMTGVPRKAVPVRTMAPTKRAAVVKRMVPTEKDLAVVAVQGVAEVASVAVVTVVTPRDPFPRQPSVSSTFLTLWMTMV